MKSDLPVCCFCFEQVPSYQAVDVVVFPTPGEDESQAFTSHRACLVDRIDRRVPLHPDLEVDFDA